MKHYRRQILKIEDVVNQAASSVDDLYSENVSVDDLVRGLKGNIIKCIEAFRQLETKEQDLFLHIMSTKSVPQKKSKRAEKPVETVEAKAKEPAVTKSAEEAGAGDQTIDDVLHEYFRSEINVHIKEIRKFLEENKSESSATHITNIISQLQALKEISMIHGYNGIEHFCVALISTLKKAKDEKRYIGNESYSIFEGIFADMQKIERYQTGSNVSEEEQRAQIDEFCNAIYESTTTSKPKPVEKTEVKEKDETDTIDSGETAGEAETFDTEEDLIAYSDKQKIYEIITDVYQQVFSNFKGRLQLDWVTDTLDQLIGGTKIALPGLEEEVGKPLREAYARRDELKNEEKKECGNIIDKIWNELFEQINESPDFSKLAPLFSEIKAIGSEDIFSLDDDQQIAKALVVSEKGRWNKIRVKLNDALVRNNNEEKQLFSGYFGNFTENCKMTGYNNYLPMLDYFSDIFNSKDGLKLDDEIIGEIEKSMDLFFDRIESKGSTGSCDDILAAIRELLEQKVVNEQADEETESAEEKPAETETIVEEDISKEADRDEEKAESGQPGTTEHVEDELPEEITATEEESEEDVEKIFFTECREYLDNAYKAIAGLQKDEENREYFTRIETAMHDIRSSAHLLNKSAISDTAATIEEVSEIFGQSSISVPDGLTEKLKAGIDDLNKLLDDENKDVSKSIEAIREVLDNIVIEDINTGETEENQKSEKNLQDVQEKPLFADDEADEDMLDIFQEEAREFITLIIDANNTLKEKPTNAKALDQLDYAAHSLKQAAKMLGFREIGEIADSLESLTVGIKNKSVVNSADLQNSVSNAVNIIEKLSKGEEFAADEIAGIIKSLEIKESAKSESGQAEEPVEQATAEDSKVNLSEIFITEAGELLEKLNADMLELEKMPESETLLTNILRNLHTMKGSARMARFENIGDLAHKLEDYFEVFKQQNTEIKQQMLNPVFSALDLISEVISAHKSGKNEKEIHFTSKLAEIDNKLFLYQNFDLSTEVKVSQSKKDSSTRTSAKKVTDEDNVIRISTGYLDNLVNMATELLVNRTELITYYEDLKKIVSDFELGKKQLYQAENLLEDVVDKGEIENTADSDKKGETGLKDDAAGDGWQNVSENFKEISRKINNVNSQLNKLSQGFERNINRIANISKELHADILKARMVPIEQLFNRYPRLVRDMAHDQDKQIELVIEDNEAELDRALVESLADPILHIIRNAVDHGIESPKERTAANKDKKGTIRLRASQDKNQVVIDISDDGRGIDLESVKKKVVKNKIATRKDVNKLSEAEILDFLFLPEFSTREKTSDVSGRGIGLNVVYNQIQKLKGIIRLKSEKNAGTTFSIRVPLTLVVAQALMIKVQGQNIAIPVIAVQESCQFKMDEVLVDDERKYLKVRGKLLPFVAINDLLNFDDSKNAKVELKSALVLHDAGVSMALGVSEIVGRQEIVIKALGDHLQNVEYITGGTILGNGEVALIVDYAAIIRLVESQFFGRLSEKISAESPQKLISEKTEEIEKAKAGAAPAVPKKRKIKKKNITNRKPKVLIVDDSISVRNFVSSVLEKKGFSTYKSSDGESAMKRIGKGDVDIVITDLEMPKMTGFQLIESIRSNDTYDDLPIVILSGKTGKDYRDKAMDIGASAFIMKPFKENDLLNVLGDFIEINQ
ncbi:MAG: hybrid sensor histidine kinase/response regulator [Calditrichaceae bacterium]